MATVTRPIVQIMPKRRFQDVALTTGGFVGAMCLCLLIVAAYALLGGS